MEIPRRSAGNPQLQKIINSVDVMVNYRLANKRKKEVALTVFKKDYALIYDFCERYKENGDIVEPITRYGVPIKAGEY